MAVRAAKVSFASPTRGTSVGTRLPARMGSASICTTLAWPAMGRNLVYGELVPTINKVSQLSSASSDGAVPEQADASSGKWVIVRYHRLARRVFTIGLAKIPQQRPPRGWRGSARTYEHHDLCTEFSTSAARVRSASRGTPGGSMYTAAVGLTTAGAGAS